MNVPIERISLRQSLVTWWVILKISLEERLVYRGDFILGTMMRFLPIITQIFLWNAVFASAVSESIKGYRFKDVVAYYLLTMLVRAFSSMPGLASGIATQIRNGEIKKFLIQPVDLLGFLLLGRVAHKLAYYSVAAIPFLIIFYLCRGFFSGWPEPQVLVAFILTLGMAFLLGFVLESCIGLIGFWFLEVSSLLFVYMLLSFFLSGHMFPLDLLPSPWDSVVNLLPLKYLAYFPSAVLLGKIPQEALMRELVIEATWIVALYIASRVMWHFGVRRYSGFGG